MKNLISYNFAVNFSLIIYGLFSLFHLLIIIGVVFFDYVPIDYLWGGKMETKDQLLSFEIISLLVMTFAFFVVMIVSGKIHVPKLYSLSKIIIWILFILFTLNTIGNLLAHTNFEKLFALITVILAVLSLRIGLEKRSQ